MPPSFGASARRRRPRTRAPRGLTSMPDAHGPVADLCATRSSAIVLRGRVGLLPAARASRGVATTASDPSSARMAASSPLSPRATSERKPPVQGARRRSAEVLHPNDELERAMKNLQKIYTPTSSPRRRTSRGSTRDQASLVNRVRHPARSAEEGQVQLSAGAVARVGDGRRTGRRGGSGAADGGHGPGGDRARGRRCRRWVPWRAPTNSPRTRPPPAGNDGRRGPARRRRREADVPARIRDEIVRLPPRRDATRGGGGATGVGGRASDRSAESKTGTALLSKRASVLTDAPLKRRDGIVPLTGAQPVLPSSPRPSSDEDDDEDEPRRHDRPPPRTPPRPQPAPASSARLPPPPSADLTPSTTRSTRRVLRSNVLWLSFRAATRRRRRPPVRTTILSTPPEVTRAPREVHHPGPPGLKRTHPSSRSACPGWSY